MLAASSRQRPNQEAWQHTAGHAPMHACCCTSVGGARWVKRILLGCMHAGAYYRLGTASHLLTGVFGPEPEAAWPLTLDEVTRSHLICQLRAKQLQQQRLGDIWLCDIYTYTHAHTRQQGGGPRRQASRGRRWPLKQLLVSLTHANQNKGFEAKRRPRSHRAPAPPPPAPVSRASAAAPDMPRASKSLAVMGILGRK